MATNTFAPNSVSLSSDQAHDLLIRYYGLEVTSLKPMDSELSSVYRIELSNGRTCAFKALPRSKDALITAEWRTAAMDQVHARGIPAGETYLNREGKAVTLAETPSGTVVLHVGEWLPGIPLELAEPTPGLLRAVGRTAAGVVTALAEWPAPPAPISHPWELTRTLSSLDATINEAATCEDRELLVEAADRFRVLVNNKLKSLPHVVVHHDMHDQNLLVDAGAEQVTGVLDFGDMVWGPRIADLAVAAGYGCRNSSDPLASYFEIIAGWGTHVPLEPAEVEVLFAASTGRLAVNLGVWSARASSDRGDYAQARSASSANALRTLFSADVQEVQSELRALLLRR